MRKRTCLVCLVALALLVSATTSVSHHSFPAEFDSTKPVKFTGKLTKIEWTNPHAWLYVDVEDAQTGTVTKWAIELGSPNGLSRLGWTRNLLTINETISVEGFLGRNKPNLANAASVTLTRTGQKLGAASSVGNR